jgi:uncharacterized membrane protein
MKPVETQIPSSERTGAAAAHVSGIFFPLLGPLVVFLAAGKSRYMRYHALHALIGMLILNIILFTAGAISLTISLMNLYRQAQENFQNFEWWPIILKAGLTWIILALIGLANTVVNIVQGIRAYQGKWPGRSLTTAIVNRFVKPLPPTAVQPELAPSEAT